MAQNYKQTIVGKLMIALMAVTLLMLIYLAFIFGYELFFIPFILIAGFLLLLFSVMTIEVDNMYLTIKLGGGIYIKKIRLTDIKSFEVHEAPLYRDWGIRPFSDGWVYSIAGFESVAVKLRDGTVYIIGTEDPNELVDAIKHFNRNRVSVS